jgi:hypothetical protein
MGGSNDKILFYKINNILIFIGIAKGPPYFFEMINKEKKEIQNGSENN